MDIVEEIVIKTNLPRDEISRKIEEKYSELSGLITKEGAAVLVAREFGVNLKNDFRSKTIKDIKAGMKNINAVGRIFKISNVNEFKKSDGSEGKVVNIWIGDDSGFLRFPLWNEQAAAIEGSQFKAGDVIQIFNGLARQNLYGYLEISLGKYGGMKIIDDTGEIPSMDALVEKYFSKNFQRVKVEDLAVGNFELQGTVVKLFGGEFVFKSCPVCNSGVKAEADKATCPRHGGIEPKPSLVLSCILDDGSGDLRIVFFRDVAEDLCGLKVSDLAPLEKENRLELLSKKLLGNEIVVSGKVKKNSLTGDLEMIATSVKDINPLDESKKLVDNIMLALGE